MLITMVVLSVPVIGQRISGDEAEKIVQEALKEITVEYPRVERECNHVEVEFQLLHNGMPISDAERTYRDATRPDSEYINAFKEELQELLPEARIAYCEYDREDREWEVSIYLAPHIDVDDIKVDPATGKLLQG